MQTRTRQQPTRRRHGRSSLLPSLRPSKYLPSACPFLPSSTMLLASPPRLSRSALSTSCFLTPADRLIRRTSSSRADDDRTAPSIVPPPPTLLLMAPLLNRHTTHRYRAGFRRRKASIVVWLTWPLHIDLADGAKSSADPVRRWCCCSLRKAGTRLLRASPV